MLKRDCLHNQTCTSKREIEEAIRDYIERLYNRTRIRGNIHKWPVGMEASDCHGWSAEDNSGAEHLNSAANITCHEDGSFSFEQYAGNFDCSGEGVLKTYYPDECEQDIPPTLYTVAVDLSCCADPDACTAAVPTVDQPNAGIYKNGILCTE